MEAIRYRCAACGNITRFDVTRTRRTRAFHHYSIAGEVTVEEEEILADSIEDISCRWCGNGRSVEPVPAGVVDPEASADGGPAGGLAGPPAS